MLICLTLLVSFLINLASFLLFLTIILFLSCINSFLIMILTVKRVCSDKHCKSGKIVCMLSSFALA